MFNLKILVLFLATSFASSALAAPLPEPSGRILLSVSGQISHQNAGEGAVFDRDMLANLDWQEFTGYTSFTDGPQTFAGPTLRSVLDAVGANGQTIQAIALNDYHVEIPVADADQYGVILAVEQNGKKMRVRDKGPIWVVYPMSEAVAAEKPHDSEMIWQLNRLEILP